MEVSGRTPGAVDTLDIGSAAGGPTVMCQPCSNDGDSALAVAYCEYCAEYFCSGCVKCHRKQTISKNHSILDGDKMPRNLANNSNYCKELCTKHTNESVKFYCPTHDEVGCADCRVLEHKECQVNLINKISDEYVKGFELGELRVKMDQVREDISKLKQCVHNKRKRLDENHEQVLKDIKAFRKEVNQNLDKMETEIKKIAVKLKRENESNLDGVEKHCTAWKTELSYIEKDLNVKSSNNDSFVKAKKAKKKLYTLSNGVKSLEKQTEVLFHRFEWDIELTERLQSENLLGRIIPLPLKPIHELEPNYIEDINLSQPNDTLCYITDLVQINKDTIILVDRNNTCIKVVDVQKKTVLSVFRLCNRPFGIAMVSSNLVVVTIPAAKKIQFLQPTFTGKLTEKYTLEVGGECIAIDCRDNLLALTYTNPSKAEIITLTGTVLHTIKANNIQTPSYIVFGYEPRTVFISNYHKGNVRKYNFNGYVLGEYRDIYMSNPAGLVLTKDGNVIICSAGERHSVHIVKASDCTNIKYILGHDVHNIESPRCVLLCEDTSRLYLCNGTGSLSRNCNNLKVFQC